MDKRKPTHDLAAFQEAFARHRAMTVVAARDAAALGYDGEDVDHPGECVCGVPDWLDHHAYQ